MLAGVIDMLIEMSGIAFMGQCCIESKRIGHSPLIDVDDICLCVVDGRNHVKCRT